MKNLLSLFLLTIASATFAMETNSHSPSLAGSSWVVTGLADAEPLAGHPVTFEFDEQGGITGDASCNSFGGECTIEGDKITVTRVRSTRRACEEPVMSQERSFLALLGSAQTWVITADDDLLLRGPEGEIKAHRRPQDPQN